MENTIKILHLEDNPNDSFLVQSVLKKSDMNFEYLFTDNEESFISILNNQEIDLILSDYHLPDYSGAEAIIYVKNNFPDIPFVFLSGTMGEDAAIESLLNGATDYVLKNKMERLVPAIHRALNEVREQKARRKAENELRKLSRAIEQSPNSIVITDTNLTIEYANPATFKLTGYSKEEVIGHSLQVLNSVEINQQYLSIVEVINSGKEWKGEFYKKRKNGEMYWTFAQFLPIFNDNGKIINYLSINENITESKKLTLELIKAKEKAEESDRLKTAFLHNISHEIRTPMNAIVGFSSFLNDPDLCHAERHQYSDIIVRSSNQLLSIISDIIDIATLEAGQEKIFESEINLNSILELLREQFLSRAKKQNVEFNLKLYLPDSEDCIISDETKLVQILTNLIGNALKFTENGHVNIEYHINGDELEFSVEDSGIGIPDEMQEEIFNRFSQVERAAARQFGGSGLGLSISKAYAELLGGKMWLKSALGKGSTFYFSVPYMKTNAPTVPETPYISDLSFADDKAKTILIAEDENSNYTLLEKALANYNIIIVRAFNGVDAIELCKTEQIDMVLMDIKMPVLDGYEATRQIRTFKPDLPIIAQTAYTSEIDKNKALSSGCTDFVSKPLNLNKLIFKIKEHLI